jgi:hypothetical protein
VLQVLSIALGIALGQIGKIRHVLVSNRGDALSGFEHSDAVVARLQPVVSSLGLDVEPSKRDAVKDADAFGSSFISLFTTFGSFSIAAGILLIFLIFVMLAADRRLDSTTRPSSMRMMRSVLRPTPDVVRHDQERQAVLLVETAHERDDLVGALGVQVAGRLVGPHDRGVVDERTGDRHALALAAGQLVGKVVGAVGDADELQRLHGAAACRCGTVARNEQRQLDVLDRRQHGDEVVELKHESHPPSAVVRAPAVGHRRQRRTLDDHVAAVDLVQSRQAVQQCRLAAAAGSHDRDHLTALEHEVNVAQRGNLHSTGVVRAGDAACFDDRAHRAVGLFVWVVVIERSSGSSVAAAFDQRLRGAPSAEVAEIAAENPRRRQSAPAEGGKLVVEMPHERPGIERETGVATSSAPSSAMARGWTRRSARLLPGHPGGLRSTAGTSYG